MPVYHGFMRLLRRGALLVLAAGLAGCAADPAPAPATGADSAYLRPMATTWQQFCEQVWSVPQANQVAAQRGADGWELAAMYGGVMCFKRPTPGAALYAAPSAVQAGASRSPAYVPAVQEPGF